MQERDMPQDERVVHTPVRHKRSLPASYIDGAVPIGIPKNPSPPVDKSPRRSAPFIPLYTGRPIESDNESRNEALPSSNPSCRTPSSSSKKAAKTTHGTSPSTFKPVSGATLTLTPLSTLAQGPHPSDSAESFAAARLESLIPLPFIASASDARHNVILPPSAPKPTPTRYTILFDAAHALILHQSVVNGSALSAKQKKQIDELTRISYRQAQFILGLERQNAMLRALAVPGGSQSLMVTAPQTEVSMPAVTTTPTASLVKKNRKRKRDEKGKVLEPAPYLDGLGNRAAGSEQEQQRKEREKKMLNLQKQRDSLFDDKS